MRDRGKRAAMLNIGIPYQPIAPEIVALVQQYGNAPEALLPILRALQAKHGWLTDAMVTSVARALGIPAAQVQGVASFYTMLATTVRPRHSLRVCDSPPCWLRGAEQIRTMALVRVSSRRGEMVARAVVTERVAPGLIFGNFHFPEEQNVNNLTIAALDPVAKIPEYKVCAVRVEPVEP